MKNGRKMQGSMGVKVGAKTRRSLCVGRLASRIYGWKSAWHEGLGAVIVFRGRGYVRGTVGLGAVGVKGGAVRGLGRLRSEEGKTLGVNRRRKR
jgi:hypothetical protein